MSVIEARLAGLVHRTAHDDPDEQARHTRFIVTRMATGIVALACIPPYLVWRGVPSIPEYLAIACLAAPIPAAVVLARTGLLTVAHAISSLALVGLVACVAFVSGGLTSPAALWLLGVPLEAFLSGRRRAVVAASAIAAGGAVLLAVLDLAGVAPGDAVWPSQSAGALLALVAIVHMAAQALAQARPEGARQATKQARDVQDRSLLQAIDDLVTWHDRDGQVLRASPAALRLVGMPASELVGQGLFARVHVSDRPAFLKALSDAATGDRPIALRFRLHPGDGSAVPDDRARPTGCGRVVLVELRAQRVEVEPGGAGDCAVVAIMREAREPAPRAEPTDAVRPEEERAEQAREHFLAALSHELRTPLNAIIGFSEMLAANRTIEAQRRRDYAEIIRDSGRHLLDVVNTLHDISKIASGNFEFAPQAFDVATLAHGCCDLMGLKAERRGILLVRAIAADLPEFVADRRACKQILINLISNATKFTPRGGRVTVDVHRRDDHIVFAIADTGIGIAERDLSRIGDPFFQAAPVHGRSHDSTGLGLSIVRGLVGLHRGALTIESALDEGTQITVSLPLDCRTGAPPAGPAPMRVVARGRRAPHRLKVG